MSNSFADIFREQVQAQQNAMNQMLKANQAVYESFQNQITNMVKLNAENIQSSTDDMVSQIRKDSEKMIAEIRAGLVGK